MTSSPIAFLTTRFGYRQYDVFDWAKKLTILEFGLEIISYFIAIFYLHYNFTWLGLVLEVVFLAFLCLEYYGIDEKKLAFIIFSCFVRLLLTLSFFGELLYFQFGGFGNLKPDWIGCLVVPYLYLTYCIFRFCLQFKVAKVAKEGESAINKGLCLDNTKDVEAGISEAKQEA